jgi:hypothetical protein
MGHPLDEAATAAIKTGDYEKAPSMCQRFVRQVVRTVYGPRFDQFRGPSAKASADLWRGSQYAIDPKRGSLPGDVLYWEEGHGPSGHVAIRVTGNRIVENSVVHHNGERGSIGTRELWQLGTPSLIVRLPSTVKRG